MNLPHRTGRAEAGNSTAHAVNGSLSENRVHFPVEALPRVLAKFILEQSASLPVPPDFLGPPMLGVLGAAIGNTREIQLKSNWREGARFYVAVVASPGSKKSPALEVVARPLHVLQARALSEYKNALHGYRLEKAKFEAARRARRPSADKEVERGEEESSRPSKWPEAPRLRQLLTTDTTIEALAAVLEVNNRGVLLVQDELRAWVLSMNQYKGGKGSDRQQWLSMWTASPMVVNRKHASEPLIIPYPHVNVIGCLQPDTVPTLLDERGREDGFLDRVLLAYPGEVKLAWSDSSVNPDILSGYQQLVETLLDLQPATNEIGDPVPLPVELSEDARRVFVHWVKDHYAEINDANFPRYLKGPWAKFEAYTARFALVLHLARNASGEVRCESVDSTSVRGAIALTNYFKSQARLVYEGLIGYGTDKRVAGVLNWLRDRGGSASIRELYRSQVAGIKSRSEAQELLDYLRQQNLGEFDAVKYPSGQRGEVFRLSAKPSSDT